MKTFALCTFVGAALFLGCGDKGKTQKDTPAGSSSFAIGAPAPPASSAAPVASAKPADGKTTWSGPYTLAAGTISIPSENKDFNGVKQAKDDPSKLMGDGKIDLTITGNLVAGTVEGAAGTAIIDGSMVNGEIRGTVRRKDPKDDGLTGTITAKIAGDSADGKLNLSEANAAIVREAKIVLKKN